MNHKVYLILHRDSGRVYIGQTRGTVLQRWREHQRANGCSHFYAAVRMYGPLAFSIFELAQGLTPDAADALEIALISEHQSQGPNGFNILPGGRCGPLGLRKVVCVRGHDCSLESARTVTRQCRACHRDRARQAQQRDAKVPELRAERYLRSKLSKERARRARGARFKGVRWTACSRGHDLTSEGTRTAGGQCRACFKIRNARAYQAKKLAQAAA